MSKGSVLVVDDKAIVAKDIARLVTKLGYNVVATSVTSEDAIMKAEKYHPDIALMDIKLKGKKDGIDTAEDIYYAHGIPSIYVTAYTDEQTLEKALNTHPYGYIVKPFEEKVLEIVLELAFRRLKAERALSDYQKDFNEKCVNFITILEKYPDYLYVSDPFTHEIIYISNAYRNLIKGDITGKKCYEVFQGNSEPCDFCTNKLILETRQPHVWDYFNKHLGRHFLNTDQIIQWPDGRNVRFETTIDITDQKQIENMLTTSEAKYRNFIENSSYGFYIINLAYEIIYLNRTARDIHGIGYDVEIHVKLSDMIHPEDQGRALAKLKSVASERKASEPGIYRIFTSDGKTRLVETQTFPIMKDGVLDGFHGTLVDVTDRMKSQSALKEKSEFLDAVISNSSEGIFVIDDEFNYVLINPASGKILGHDPKEWIGRRAGTNKHPDDEQKGMDTIMKVFSEGSSEVEIRVKSLDGKYHLLYIRYTLMSLNNRDHVLGIVTDITERKRAEEALKESEVRYKTLYNQATEGIIFMPIDSEKLVVNDSFARMHGYDSAEDMVQIKWQGLDTPETAKLAKERTERMMAGEALTFEVEHYRKDGKTFPLFVSCKVINIGGVPHYMGFHQDITKKKKAEQTLIASEEKYRSLFENSPESIVILGKEGKIIECNGATAGLMEKRIEDIIGKKFDELGIFDSAQLDTYRKIFKSMTEGKEMNKGEIEIFMKGGRSKWIEIFPSMIAKAGDFYGIQMIARDITDHKLADIEMRKKLLKFDIEPGNVYLSKESSASHSLEAFRELLMVGNEGLLISRNSRKDFQNQIDYAFNHVKVSETDKENHIKPDYKAIQQLVSNLPRGHVLHIDCIEYLISWIGAKKTIMLVQYLKDLAITKGLVVLVSIDPNVIPEKELRLIEKESVEMLPSQSLTRLSQKFVDILKFIDDMNRGGTLPSYSDISEYFELSKPTARNRIRQLIELGTVNEIQKGRMKILEITDKGKNYLVV